MKKGNYMRIYLADAELIVTKTLKGFLDDLGHDVLTFNSISELLRNNEENGADIIIIDLNMPCEESIKTISEIHRIYPETDIVIMSSILPTQEAIKHGVYSYLNKPVRFGELELILARLSERHINRVSGLYKSGLYKKCADH